MTTFQVGDRVKVVKVRRDEMANGGSFLRGQEGIITQIDKAIWSNQDLLVKFDKELPLNTIIGACSENNTWWFAEENLKLV